MKSVGTLAHAVGILVLVMHAMFTEPLLNHSSRVFATAGLPTVSEFSGLFTVQEFLTSDDEIQKVYTAGVLDALLAVVAEGEEFEEVGLDPRNAYGIVYEAIAGIPTDLSLDELRDVVTEHVTTDARDQAAALAIWRNLALYHCCWDQHLSQASD